MNEISYQRTKSEILRLWTIRTLLRKSMILRTIGLLVCGVLMFFLGDFYPYIGAACLIYLVLLPFQTVVAFNRVLKTNPIFTYQTVLRFGDTGITLSGLSE